MKTLAAIREADGPFIGGKAAELARLVRAGFPVPEAAILDTRDIARFSRGIPPPDLAALISRCAAALRARGYAKLVVRSSPIGGNGMNPSSTGKFECVLAIPAGDFGALLAAIAKCLAAADAKRATALVIQGMVAGDASGALFTLDPLRGLDTTHVIVGGTANPERVHYDWMNETETRTGTPSATGAPLKPAEVRELSKLATKLQLEYGIPLDLEWTRAGGKFFLLRARPITRVSFETDEEWTNANMRDGGVAASVATPFIASQYRMMMNRTMPDYFTRMRMLPKSALKPPKGSSKQSAREWTRVVCGHFYWNLTATKRAVRRLPGFIEREFDVGFGIAPNYAGDGVTTPLSPKSLFHGLRILSALKHSLKNRPAASEAVARRSDGIYAELTPETVAKLSDVDLATRALRLIEEDWLAIEGGTFYHIYDNSNCRTLFMKALDKYNRKAPEKVPALELVTGLGEIPSLAPIDELYALSRRIRADAEARDGFAKRSPADFAADHRKRVAFPFDAEIRKFIAAYRYRWDDDPTPVFESLSSLVKLDDRHDPRPGYARSAETFARARGMIRSAKLLRLLDQHRALLKQRETLRIHSIRTLYLVRLVFLEVGRRLVRRGDLRAADDIFYLPYPDALALFRGEETAARLARLEKLRVYTEGYRHFRKPSEIRAGASAPAKPTETPAATKAPRIRTSEVLAGAGCSSGSVEGEVCVIRSAHELARLKPASILVAEFVDPAWTISFVGLKGLITETGGVLSHGAVVAREYGFPAILAVPDAARKLKPGSRIRMDGTSGQITVLAPPPPVPAPR